MNDPLALLFIKPIG